MSKSPKRSTKVTEFHRGRGAKAQAAIETSRTQRQNRAVTQSDEPVAPIAMRKKRVDLIPRNVSQERYIKALNDESLCYVFAMGPAGTGKTMMATQFAIKCLREGLCDKIVITRPAVSTDEEHGFLPGTLLQKMEPWILPILDVFKEYYHPAEVTRMMEEEVIQVSPLAYMRGRTFKNAIIIGDEMQNAKPSQMKMLLTRIGEGSKMIITGDITQHDRGYEENGLKDFVERFENRGSARIRVINFEKGDVERHPAIEEILDIYDDLPDA